LADQPPIAGVGFTAGGLRPDLSDVDETLARIEDAGVSHCELPLFAAQLVSGGRVLPDMACRLEAACARRRLRYTVHGVLSVNLMDEPNLAHHERVARAMLELTAAVGATVMVHHPGVVPSRPAAELDRLHALERSRLRELGDLAARLGVRIAVETLFVESDRVYTADPARLAAEIRAVDHPHVVGTLDVSHSYIMTTFRGLPFREAVHAFAPVTGHVHLHDSFGRPTSVDEFYTPEERMAFGMGDLHLPFGWGDIPFEDLLPGLPVLPGTVLNVELPPHFAHQLEPCAAFALRLADRMNAAAR
jgi:sugar phosphate isomerase/epimerase